MPPIGEWLTFEHNAGFDADWATTTSAGSRPNWSPTRTPGRWFGAPADSGSTGSPSRAGGKSGGARVCYAHFPDLDRVLLLFVYGKSRTADLSAADRRAVAELLREYRRAHGG